MADSVLCPGTYPSLRLASRFGCVMSHARDSLYVAPQLGGAVRHCWRARVPRRSRARRTRRTRMRAVALRAMTRTTVVIGVTIAPPSRETHLAIWPEDVPLGFSS